MEIIIWANDEQQQEILSKKRGDNVTIQFADGIGDILQSNADTCFILKQDIDITTLAGLAKPVFINSVTSTIKELNVPKNISRINGWPTFLQRDKWEIATQDETSAKDIFEKLSWNYIIVKDEPGLVAARIVAMIINEAYFALGDNISTKNEIDIAMKLGTNYPHGPFEWAQKIGLRNIYALLKRLGTEDKRYTVAPAMEKELG